MRNVLEKTDINVQQLCSSVYIRIEKVEIAVNLDDEELDANENENAEIWQQIRTLNDQRLAGIACPPREKRLKDKRIAN